MKTLENPISSVAQPIKVMHLIKKVLHHKTEPGGSARQSSQRKDDHPTSSSDGDTKAEIDEGCDDGPKRFIQLPNELQMAILQYLSYDDIAKIRRQLGIDIDREKLRIKRELPRRESMRRSHRLSRLNDAYAGLDTRFSIMAMTYRKFIDMKVTCFIPGKVLDEFFRIIDILKKSHDRGGTLAIDIHELLKDLRDLSSMAMEHFEEHVQPSLSTSTSGSLSSSYFMSVHPLLRPTLQTPSSTRDVDSCEWRKNITDKLAQQDKIIRKQNGEIISLKSCIRQLVLVCTQLTDQHSQKGVDDILEGVLDTVSMDGTASQINPQEPSNSSSDAVGESLKRCYKQIYVRQHSHESCAKKRPRFDDSTDED
ncbi:F-box domain-containing protein [Trichostrongylus colubriformis]|uniref:F-box domain-containing protein n=1 Tax=Trichostrongylus colubriformis TaxID=6319 RepID=A0AAN8F411_TRICO